MRIDPALSQRILVAIEDDPKAGSGQFLSFSIDGYTDEQIAHHIKYLWDSKLVRGQELTNMTSPYPEIAVQDITPRGRAYLEERVQTRTNCKETWIRKTET